MAKKRVLIVEDEPDVARTMQLLLEEEGFEVGVALGGEKGLEMVKDFDLMLLDLMMPKMSGRDVMKEMKEKGIKKPIIVVSAAGLPDMIRQELWSKYPGTSFVSKPHMYQDLVAEVKKALKMK